MHQKLIRTIPFGPGHTLDTLNHGLESLFDCFITHFGAGDSLDPPGAPVAPPWCPPDPCTVGLDPSLGKSTDETMQLFYLCGFVQTYGNIGGLFLHT